MNIQPVGKKASGQEEKAQGHTDDMPRKQLPDIPPPPQQHQAKKQLQHAHHGHAADEQGNHLSLE